MDKFNFVQYFSHIIMFKMNFSNFGNIAGKSLTAAALFFLELVKIALLALVTILLIRYYLFKPFYVKGASMEPTFYEKEYLIIDEITYRFREPERGEVIVFRYPENPKEYFLKRIIGLPGETIKITEGKIYIYNQTHPEGVAIDEKYLTDSVKTSGDKIKVLGKNEFFVLGDNRENSYDSRRFGPVDRSLIVGRTWFRGWPLNRMQILEKPDFQF